MELKHQETTENHPWWDRPLWGDHSFRETLIELLKKETIPEDIISVHDASIKKLERLAPKLVELDDKKFTEPEFVLLLNIHFSLETNKGEYAGLKESQEMMKAVLEAKDSFLRVDATEFQFRSFAQQQFYQDIFALLSQSLTRIQLNQKLQILTEKTLQKLTTEEGIKAIKSYSKELNHLSLEHKLGLRLLYLFKQYDFAEFSILQEISNLVGQLIAEEKHNPKEILAIIKNQISVFEKLGKIIGIKPRQNNAETYMKMIQYIVLMEKHKSSYLRFKDLLSHLRKWQNSYNTVKRLRDEHPSKMYQLPKTFREKVPGLVSYEKYQSWLTV